jgi:hypothetical protein
VEAVDFGDRQDLFQPGRAGSDIGREAGPAGHHRCRQLQKLVGGVDALLRFDQRQDPPDGPTDVAGEHIGLLGGVHPALADPPALSDQLVDPPAQPPGDEFLVQARFEVQGGQLAA